MEGNTLTINYPNGKMMINLPEFFPAEVWRIKELLKVINLNREWEWERGYRDRIIRDLISWLTEYLAEKDDPDVLKKLADEAVESRTWGKEQQAGIDRLQEKVNSHAEHVKQLKKRTPEYEKESEALKNAKDLLKSLKFTQMESFKNARYCEQKIETRKRQVEKLKKNIEILKEESRKGNEEVWT